MLTVFHGKNESIRKGLGMCVKINKIQKNRFDMLSKLFTVYDGRPIVVRPIKKILLTNSMLSDKLTEDEGHTLAAYSLYNSSLDPLTKRMIELRLGLAT